MLNIEKKNCTGCEACVNACPYNCISMEMDNEGFYYPQIRRDQCVSCGKCEKVCGRKVMKTVNKSAYAGFSKNKCIREKSSSGGIFSEISINVIENNGAVYGAAYDDEMVVRHIRISSIEDLWKLRGSKYVQSIIGDSYRRIYEDLKQKIQVLFVGTPCQIDGLYRFLGEDSDELITCAVVCHGVPSPGVFRRFVNYQQGRIGSEIKNVEFRNKEYEGWHNYYIKYEYSDFFEYYNSSDDLYFKGFLENLFLRESCYECFGKQKTDLSDIILGDYWGVDEAELGIDSYYGVSAIIVNTAKGEKIIRDLFDTCHIKRTEYGNILKANPALEFAPKRTDKRDSFFRYLEVTHDVIGAIEENLAWQPTNGKKEIQLYPILEKYMEELLSDKTISKKLQSRGKQRTVLYANTELMKLFRLDLKKEKIDYILSDMNLSRIKKMYPNDTVMSREMIIDEYKSGRIDCIIVCSVTYENEIVDGLISEGISLNDIINATELICALN